jgi:D-glycero-D-manno-heptose 1,7-bisphosphate phosphatase
VLVILDRDGVINAYEEGQYICRLEDWVPLPGSIEAIGKLCRAGYQVAVATNQSGISRGYYSRATVDQIHNHLQQLVTEAGGRIDYFAVCPHHPDEHCRCRKPESGLLLEIQEHFGLADLHQSWMLGDSRKDLEAALAAGCKPVLVSTGGGRSTLAGLRQQPLPGIEQATDLSDFVSRLLD